MISIEGYSFRSILVVAVLPLLWILETRLPFFLEHQNPRERIQHDAKNISFGILNASLVAWPISAALAASAAWSQGAAFGILHRLGLPQLPTTCLAFLLLDLWMYLWHRANHGLPFLWRFHKMHHSDAEMSASTGVRFHTGEVLLSALARLVIVPVLGITLAQLAIYELVLLPAVLIQHSNVVWPGWFKRARRMFVTPEMHRIHHSRWPLDTNSNYGSIFTWWDFLGRTFHGAPIAEPSRPGLNELDDAASRSWTGMLRTPFRRIPKRFGS